MRGDARMKNYVAKKKFKTLIGGSKEPVKLNIGCGTDYKEGWINIDNNSDDNITRLDLNWDLRYPLPCEDGSVDFIFHEHFMEHLTVEEGIRSTKDFLRVLKPGGVLRIATPDLDEAVTSYQDQKWKEKPFIKRFQLEFVETKAEMINMKFRWWGHKWLYDWEELDRRLREAGCQHIRRCKLRKSAYPELCGLETRDESTLIAEVRK